MESQTNESAPFSSINPKLSTPPPKLIGYAELPADTIAEGPPSGSALANPTNGRPTPFSGQPVQGFSGVQFSKGGNGKNLLFLSDNGYGALGNSADYLLRIQELDPDFRGSEAGNGSVSLKGYIQLSDPNKKVPFKIVQENTSERLLTGADFDVESIAVAPDGDLWIGDEFGPYLLHFDSQGKLLDAPYPTPNSALGSQVSTLTGASPLVIGHRGASGELPEHTLEGYRLAILRGADFIEPDLVSTKDGQLIARHEPNLINTTDVENRPEFASRKTTKLVDGVVEDGFFASDFTLAEIKTLRTVMPQGFRTQAFNGTFEIPTLGEIIDLVKDMEAKTGKRIGIYPETKHPTYHDQLGLSLEEKLLAVLKEKNFVDPGRIFIQSFEVSNLKELSTSLMPAAGVKLPLVQLLDAYDVDDNGALIYEDVNARPYDFTVKGDTRTYADLQTPAGLAEIATYAKGIGPWKPMILSTKTVDANKDGKPDDLNGDGVVNGQDRILSTPSSLVVDAHAKGLFVHAYTFRNEPRYLASSYANNPQVEYATFYKLGVDGLFSDYPGTADLVRDQLGEVRSPQSPGVRISPEFKTLKGQTPIVIGHRGDSGHRPEHTLASYRSAIAKGANFIEPDLVITKDNVLIARHEPMLAVVQLDANGAILRDSNGNPILNTTDTSTDVYKHQEFANRLTVKRLDGVLRGGWFAEDFTLAEIKQLNAIERIPAIRGNKYDNDGLKIPTLVEVINLVKQVEAETGRKIGIYPETKHPSYFLNDGIYADGITAINKDTSQILVNTLKTESFTDPSRVFVQSFEVDNLERLNSVIMPAAGIDLPLIQLFGGSGKPYDFVLSGDSRTYDDLSTVAGLATIKSYAEGIGPNKARILPMTFQDANGDGKRDDLNGDGQISDADTLVGKPTSLVSDAHKAGLLVHLYTLRDDTYFLPSSYNGEATKEYQAFIDLGVDGFFTDFPDTGNAVLASRYLAGYGVGTTPERFGDQISPNLGASGGFEGMAASPDGKTLYPLLEKTVNSDVNGSLRIYSFDVAAKKFTGLTGYYQMEKSTNAIGDMTPINNHEFIVIERDSTEGNEQGFKKLFKIDINKQDANGFVAKEEIVNLMAIDDPNDLNRDGKFIYSMPFVTIEDVLVLNENTVLVANDNNYPFSKGRPPAIDNNEIVTIQLSQPVDLDPRLGMGTPGLTPKPTISLSALSADKPEGNIGSTPFTFTISRNGDSSVPISVDWGVTGSGANAANALDFAGSALPSGVATLAPWQTSQQITLNVVGDRSLEADEAFTLSLSNPVGGSILAGAASAKGRIHNDDLPSPVQPEAALPAQTFLVGTEGRSVFREVLDAGELGNNGYRFNGTPDGIGVMDNGDGTLRVLVNHEFGPTAGDVRAHGSKGAYVSDLTIDKATLSVTSGKDFLASANDLFLASADGSSWSSGATTAFARFCSGDLAAATAFRNGSSGYNGRIYITGEETGPEGRAFAHVLSGSDAGKVFELPSLGNLSFENVVANPLAQNKTVVASLDDTSTNGQVYVYIGSKSNTGNAVQQAGLAGGITYGVRVNSAGTTNTEVGNLAKPNETGLGLNSSGIGTFELVNLGDVKAKTGATLNSDSITAGVTNWLRPEDGAWSKDGKTFYFVTTASTTSASRLWALEFTNPASPELGGTVKMLLNGSEGQIMLDNMTVADDGSILLQEDPGANERLAKVWRYNPSTDTLVELAQHNPVLFSGTTATNPNFITNDEESSGIVEISSFLNGISGYDTSKYNYFLIADQIHKAVTSPTSQVEMGELSVMATAKLNAKQEPSYTFSKSADAVDEGSSLAIGVSTANVPPGSPLYWRFSGAGITASDFSDDLLEGSTMVGADGRAGFSKAIAADAINDPNETLELRFYSDSARTQQVGTTLSVLLKQPSVGVITDGSDVITGSGAAEIIIGVPSGSTLRGQGSLDRLTGGGGNDLFVLGDATGRFYDDGTPGLGSSDLALISDFNAGDRIQLYGLATDYRLISGRYGGVAGVRIDALSPSPEAIGFVQGATLASLNLANSSQFLFV